MIGKQETVKGKNGRVGSRSIKGSNLRTQAAESAYSTEDACQALLQTCVCVCVRLKVPLFLTASRCDLCKRRNADKDEVHLPRTHTHTTTTHMLLLPFLTPHAAYVAVHVCVSVCTAFCRQLGSCCSTTIVVATFLREAE